MLSSWPPLAADPGGGSPYSFILLFGPLFVIWFFLVIRPQQKQRQKVKDLLQNLKTGDRVVTSGGLYGTIVGFRGPAVQLQIASQVKIDIARSAITGLQADDESSTDAESKGKK
jgi:preprotein translocase subunit YajC